MASLRDCLTVGSRVRVSKIKSFGTVRFSGETQFAAGTWVGVELDAPEGKNDGTVQEVRYFECAPQHGLFTRPEKVGPIEDGSPLASPRSPRGERTRVGAGEVSQLKVPEEGSPVPSPRLGRTRVTAKVEGHRFSLHPAAKEPGQLNRALSSAGTQCEVVGGPLAGHQGPAWRIPDAAGEVRLLVDCGGDLRIVAPEDCRMLAEAEPPAAKVEKRHEGTAVVELERQLEQRTRECSQLKKELEGAQDTQESLRAELQHMQEGPEAQPESINFEWVGRAAEDSSDEEASDKDMHAFDEDLSLLMT